MPCLTRTAAMLATLLLVVAIAIPVVGGWRPEVETQTDAEWLDSLDSRLAPVHGVLNGTLEMLGTAGSAEEVDAYVVIVQAQAAKGIGILDSMGPAPACAIDYVAVERVTFLLWGDSVDAFRQSKEGSSQATAEVSAMVPAADFLLKSYGDRVRLGACVEVIAQPTALPEPAAPSTATPMETGDAS